jgi:DNA-binding response OmpR family regulator
METILVVDDEPALLELLVDVLLSEGYEVVPARDGVIALEVLTATKVDLVVTDAMMPRLDGLGLVRALRGHLDLREIPVILTSAANQPDLDGLEPCVFLSKPFELAALLATVDGVLRRDSARDHN